MSRERRRFEGELQAFLLAWLGRKLLGDGTPIDDLNPYAERQPEPPRSPEQLERESAAAWQLVDKFFGGK